MRILKVLTAKVVMRIGGFSSCLIGPQAHMTLSSDEEDETAELLRELEKIKRERAEQRAQEVSCAIFMSHRALT